MGEAKYAKTKKPKFKKNLFLFPAECKKKTTCMIVMSMKASTKIVKFIAPGSGFQALGLAHYGQIINMYLILVNLDLHMHCIFEQN